MFDGIVNEGREIRAILTILCSILMKTLPL